MIVRRSASLMLSALLCFGAADVARAQALPVRALAPLREKVASLDDIPDSHRPPAGMCRIWLNNVPPAQQPAPTDCASAIRNRPSNGRVIYPEDVPRAKRDEGAADRSGDKGDLRDEKKDDKKGEKKGKPRKPSESRE